MATWGSRGCFYGGLLLAACLLPLGNARGATLAIVNGDFQSPVLTEGSFVFTGIPGWTVTSDAGVLNPTTAMYSSLAAGDQVGFMNSGNAMTNTLSDVLEAGAYQVTLVMGRRLGKGDSSPFTVTLLAGGVEVGSVTGVTGEADTFVPVVLAVAVAADDPRLGQALAVRISNDGIGIDRQINPDNVQVTYNTVPEPGALAVLLVGGLGLLGWRRRA